jgi:hypothetical protein
MNCKEINKITLYSYSRPDRQKGTIQPLELVTIPPKRKIEKTANPERTKQFIDVRQSARDVLFEESNKRKIQIDRNRLIETKQKLLIDLRSVTNIVSREAMLKMVDRLDELLREHSVALGGPVAGIGGEPPLIEYGEPPAEGDGPPLMEFEGPEGPGGGPPLIEFEEPAGPGDGPPVGPFEGPVGPFEGPAGPFEGPAGPFEEPVGPGDGPVGPGDGPVGPGEEPALIGEEQPVIESYGPISDGPSEPSSPSSTGPSEPKKIEKLFPRSFPRNANYDLFMKTFRNQIVSMNLEQLIYALTYVNAGAWAQMEKKDMPQFDDINEDNMHDVKQIAYTVLAEMYEDQRGFRRGAWKPRIPTIQPKITQHNNYKLDESIKRIKKTRDLTNLEMMIWNYYYKYIPNFATMTKDELELYRRSLYKELYDFYDINEYKLENLEGWEDAIDYLMFFLNVAINNKPVEPQVPQTQPDVPSSAGPSSVGPSSAGPIEPSGPSDIGLSRDDPVFAEAENIMKTIINDVINGQFKLEDATPDEQELIRKMNNPDMSPEEITQTLEAIQGTLQDVFNQINQMTSGIERVSDLPEEQTAPEAGPSTSKPEEQPKSEAGPSTNKTKLKLKEPEAYQNDSGLTDYQVKRLSAFEEKLITLRTAEAFRREYEELIQSTQVYEDDYKNQLKLKNKMGGLKTNQRFIDEALRNILFFQWKYKLLQKKQTTDSKLLNEAYTNNNLLNRTKSLYEPL